MQIRPWAEFDTDLPLDYIEDDDGELLQYPGKAVSEAIAKMLEGLGCEVDVPQHAHEHGWQFSFKSRKQNLWCQVTYIERWLLVCEARGGFFGTSRKAEEEEVTVLTGLNAALSADLRFSNLRWYTNEEVHTDFPGAEAPVSP